MAQSSTIHKQTTHSHKTVDLDDVSFTYTVYKSVKGQQGIESSVRHYVPKRAFHMVWIAAAPGRSVLGTILKLSSFGAEQIFIFFN